MPANTNAFRSKLPAFHRSLHRWYQTHGRRDLPWRNTRDPYAIYVSEIMLQQTQVKTVLERYYSPFLKRFPTLAALARASSQHVMKAWEGLGYYTRARNLHAAAQQCRGALPSTAEGLMGLPGIGRNTAHAIACFAFGAEVPVMEANVKRVLHRVFALKKADDKTLWEKARQLLDSKNPFDYNQAMMDIGAMVCTKRNPRCDVCPLAILCAGKASPALYPAAKRAKAVPMRKRVIVVIKDVKDCYYLVPRKTRFLGGLYGFMELEENAVAVLFAGKKHSLKYRLGQITQAYSHFTLHAQAYLLQVNAPLPSSFTLAQIEALPLSGADRKVVKLLENALIKA